MSSLTLEGLRKAYGGVAAVGGVSLSVRQGEFVSLLGPSGCGKTTILRMIAGLIEPDGGRILFGDADVTRVPPNRRNVGLVFQSYALFPHMSVFENVAFGLRRRRTAETEVRGRVAEALAMVRLEDFGDRLPAELSGGQQQRVALARAIAPRPALLLLDEPLSNLDAVLREEMQVELQRLQRELGLTTVFVTHDQAEALALSDRVCVLDRGRLLQVGPPDEIYHRPAHPFVAGFLGRSRSLAGVVAAGEDGRTVVALDDGPSIRAAATGIAPGTRVRVTLRQESLEIRDGAPVDGAAAGNAFRGRIVYRAFTGATLTYMVALDAGPELMVEAPGRSGAERLAIGREAWVGWPAEATIVLPEAPPPAGDPFPPAPAGACSTPAP